MLLTLVASTATNVIVFFRWYLWVKICRALRRDVVDDRDFADSLGPLRINPDSHDVCPPGFSISSAVMKKTRKRNRVSSNSLRCKENFSFGRSGSGYGYFWQALRSLFSQRWFTLSAQARVSGSTEQNKFTVFVEMPTGCVWRHRTK